MASTPIPIEVGKPAFRALTENGFKSLHQLAYVNEKELLRLHGVGPKAVKVIKAALKKHNIKANML